jgi:hypothetical protein
LVFKLGEGAREAICWKQARSENLPSHGQAVPSHHSLALICSCSFMWDFLDLTSKGDFTLRSTYDLSHFLFAFHVYGPGDACSACRRGIGG